jgi:hypothetical protein
MKIFVLVGFSFMILVSCSTDPESWPKDPFNEAVWARTTEGERYKVALDLRDRKVLQGKTAEEVKQLLGAPSYESKDYITYIVKIGGRGFNEIYLLDIRMNGSGVVEKVLIRGD